MNTFNKARALMTLRRLGGAGVVFLLITTASGCGIPNYAYLSPPKFVEFFYGSTSATFTNATDNNPDIFQGYQIYGKFYNSSIGIDSEANTITSFSKLLSLDFLRLVKPDGTNADTNPVILIEDEAKKNSNFKFNLDFSGVPTVITNTRDAEVIEVMRSIFIGDGATGDRVLKSFHIDDLLPEHSDLVKIKPPSEGITLNYIYLSLFVLSYGRESDGYTAVYSEPVYLGYVELPVHGNADW